METTTITAADSRSALAQVADRLGPDAVIIETRKTRNGVEIVAGVERERPSRSLRATPKTDPMIRFIAQARAVGVDPELLADELARGGDDLADVWSHFLVRIERDLSLLPPPHREISHLCVVGDSGSAKTTTLAQIAALARAESPDESFALLAADHRLGAREQLRVIASMLDLPMVEPAPRESLTDAVVRLGGKRRLFIDMPSDPRLASCDVSELRACFGRSGVLTVLCTLPLNGQIARHAQVAQLFASAFDGYVLTHAGQTLPPGAAVTMLLKTGTPLAAIGRSAALAGGLDTARSTSLCRMVAAALSAGASATLQ